MKGKTSDMQSDVYYNSFSKNSTIFLKELTEKIKTIKRNIKDLEKSREKIIEKIVNEDKTNNPKNKRKHKNDSETALECINIISNNLHELSNEYKTIDQLNGFIAKRYDNNCTDYHLKIDIGKLNNQIKHTKELENKIEEDNEKNYLIINNFLDDEEDNKIKNKYDYTDVNEVTLKNLKDNLVLKICEDVVELPYTKKEIEEFMKEYPDDYKTPQDVISKEFIVSISMFKKHPILSRFKEAYYLCRTKEMMTIFDSFNYAKSIMFRSDINAYIIAAAKSKQQFEDYIYCLDNNQLNDFKCFKIVYEINPAVTTLF